jgi:hypothetical protein
METETKTEFYNNENGLFKVTIVEPKEVLRNDLNYYFNVGFAQKYGLNESIILQNLIFWTQTNKANDNNFYDGYYWTYNSIKALKELFPFWTERQIRYILESLENKGIIKTGNYNTAKYDQTKWYDIIDNSILQFCQIKLTDLSNQVDENVKPIPDINPYNKPDIKPDNKDADKSANIPISNLKEKEKKIAVRDNVNLTEKEIEKLKENYASADLDKAYDKLSFYKLSKGKIYKSDYGALNMWVFESLNISKTKKQEQYIPDRRPLL